METQEKLVRGTGFEPVTQAAESAANTSNQGVAKSLPETWEDCAVKISPQSSPQHPVTARLSRRDLRDLIQVLDVEIGQWTLTQLRGARALELKQKLETIYKHGLH